jgi:high-affinity nickel permease
LKAEYNALCRIGHTVFLALDTALSDNDLYPVLLGTAFLAYSFVLRHAVDADHVAAIDNFVLGFTF